MSKETSYYAKEEEMLQQKLEEMQNKGAEEHEIRQQERLRTEASETKSVTQSKLRNYWMDLHKHIKNCNETEAETEEFKAAFNILKESQEVANCSSVTL
ncbi:DgyrCDS4370 [Dimorphilus gyrociliatus]|uniref:Tubulin-specific chaperone A n=1 Tax=Dimorphilus gyrociliatus TaxID=2664684 RepID=A0A7I8VGH0_9ANNE|nr:DgyrCDS4370 [Dimorphilus gyrociliatus]